MKDFEAILKDYGFRDKHTHALENCTDYQDLLCALRAATAEIAELKAIGETEVQND